MLTPDFSRFEGNIKGANCVNTIAETQRLLGPGFKRFVAKLPSATQTIATRRVLAVEWLPLRDWAPFVQGVYDELGQDEGRMLTTARGWANADFSGIYKFLLRFGSPQFILARTSKVWSTYFDVGTLEAPERRTLGDRQEIILRLRDFVPWPIFGITLQSFILEVLTLSGAKLLSVQLTRRELKANRLECDFTISYR